jgi:hypothetical protein
MEDMYECNIQNSTPQKSKTRPNEYDYIILYGIFVTLIDIYFLYKFSKLSTFINYVLVFVFFVISLALCIIVTVIYYNIKNTKGQKGQTTVSNNSKIVINQNNKTKVNITEKTQIDANISGVKPNIDVKNNSNVKVDGSIINVTGNTTNLESTNVNSIKKKLVSKLILFSYFTVLSILNAINFAYKIK